VVVYGRVCPPSLGLYHTKTNIEAPLSEDCRSYSFSGLRRDRLGLHHGHAPNGSLAIVNIATLCCLLRSARTMGSHSSDGERPKLANFRVLRYAVETSSNSFVVSAIRPEAIASAGLAKPTYPWMSSTPTSLNFPTRVTTALLAQLTPNSKNSNQIPSHPTLVYP